MIKAKKAIVWASFGALVLTLAGVMPAVAQDFSDMSCQELWETRNEFFHKHGYCFKTQKGKRHFSNQGCYHRSAQAALNDMSRNDRDFVKLLKAEEDSRGCGSGRVTSTTQQLPTCASPVYAQCERIADQQCNHHSSDRQYQACYDRADKACARNKGCQ